MMTREQITEQMAGVRDTVLSLITGHEKAEHGGEVCSGQRASVIAYLMHSLGLTRRQLLTVLGYLDAYDRDCARQGGCVAHPAGDVTPLPPVTDGRTPEELREDGDDRWPDGRPYTPPAGPGPRKGA